MNAQHVSFRSVVSGLAVTSDRCKGPPFCPPNGGAFLPSAFPLIYFVVDVSIRIRDVRVPFRLN